MKIYFEGFPTGSRRDYFKLGLSILLWILLFCCSSAYGEPLEAAQFPSLISSLKIKGPLTLFSEPVPLDRQEVKERLEKEMLLSLWDRPQIILWLKRSSRFLPIIGKILGKNGIPDDFKYVAVVESALRPHVGSPKGAMGFWQFTQETGRRYGLQINDRIDERRNIYASTKAAVKYFKKLYEIFHSWTLAAAAFNMGEHGLKSEMLLQGIQGYYRLYLPLETQRYIFRILSAKMIVSDPAKYGIKISEEDCYPQITAEKVKVECIKEIPIRLIAEAAETDFKVIKDLNPEIRGYYLAPGNYNILIPRGSAKGFQLSFGKYYNLYQKAKNSHVHTVQEGDNLTTISEKYNIPLLSLLIQNQLNPNQPIHPGDTLIISPVDFEKHQLK